MMCIGSKLKMLAVAVSTTAMISGMSGCSEFPKQVFGIYDNDIGIKPESKAVAPATVGRLKPVVPAAHVDSTLFKSGNGLTGKRSHVHPELMKRVSISASDVPVKDILMRVARSANVQLDISGTYDKKISVRLTNTPLQAVLDRLAEKADFKWRFANGILIVTPDNPYWHTYDVDFLNIVKESSSSASVDTNVGSAAVSGGGGSGGNKEEINSHVKQDFWGGLGKLLNGIVSGDGDPSQTQDAVATAENGGDAQAQSGDAQAQKNAGADSTQTGGKVLIDSDSGLISVYGNSKIQAKAKEIIDRAMERVKRQVLIEATIVEVQLSDEYRAGIDWNKINMFKSTNPLNPNKDFVFQVSKQIDNATVQSVTPPTFGATLISGSLNAPNVMVGIRLLQKFGKVKVVSSPKILAMNNQASMLKVVDNEAYFTLEAESTNSNGTVTTTYTSSLHTVPVGFMMSLVPFVDKNKNVTLNVRPTLSRIIKYVKDPNPNLAQAGVQSLVPIVQEREMNGTLHLKSGQIAVIGGLMQSSRSDNTSGLPGVSDVPLLNKLTDYKERDGGKTELIIFLRPVVVNGQTDIMSNSELMQYRKKFNEFSGGGEQ